jgi:hypothetical protein
MAAFAEVGESVDVSLTPRSRTAWLRSIAPAPRRRARAASTAASNSVAWLACSTIGDRPGQRGDPGDEGIVHAVGQHDRQARVHAQAAHVRDRGEALGQFGELRASPATGVAADSSTSSMPGSLAMRAIASRPSPAAAVSPA